jgi:Putative Tad-like Flp pilus-assembly
MYPIATKSSRSRRRHGVVLAFLVLLLVMFAAITSLAVDYGRVQLIKSEMQRTADATARGYMYYYNTQGQTYANSKGPALYSSKNNPIDANSGTAPTVTVTWGYWSTTSNVFTTTNTTGYAPAVKVTVTRTNAGGNPALLYFGKLLGVNSIDLHASAIAAQMGGQTTSVTISGTNNIYMAGMPVTTISPNGGDTELLNPATQVASIPVTPGTFLTFTNLSGTTSVDAGSFANTGPSGSTAYPVYHGQSFDNNPDAPQTENGIADALMYEDATVGLFLNNNEPDTTAAPASIVDWTQTSQNNQATYSNLALKTPFMIGDGQTTGGATQAFQVPAGATRFYIGIWDGYEYNNNSGSLTGTVTVQHYVQLVQ